MFLSVGHTPFQLFPEFFAFIFFLYYINRNFNVLVFISCVLFLLCCQRYSRGLLLGALDIALILIVLVRRWVWQNYGEGKRDGANEVSIHNELLTLFRLCFQYLVFIVATIGIYMAGFYFTKYLPGTGSKEMIGFAVWWHGIMIGILGLGIFLFNLRPLYKLVVQYRSK